jgi:hypothetical protein
VLVLRTTAGVALSTHKPGLGCGAPSVKGKGLLQKYAIAISCQLCDASDERNNSLALYNGFCRAKSSSLKDRIEKTLHH